MLKNNNLPKAVPAIVYIGLSTAIEGYLTSEGTFCYGSTYISELLGYASNYLSKLLKPLEENPKVTEKPSKKLKALQEKGFQGYQKSYSVRRTDRRGSPIAKTISFDDFCLLVEYEAKTENSKAIALLATSFRELLNSRTQEAFGIETDSYERRLATFQELLEKREAELAEDREDVERLKIYGDEELIPEAIWWQSLADAYSDCELEVY